MDGTDLLDVQISIDFWFGDQRYQQRYSDSAQVHPIHRLVGSWVLLPLGPLLEILHTLPLLIRHHNEGFVPFHRHY